MLTIGTTVDTTQGVGFIQHIQNGRYELRLAKDQTCVWIDPHDVQLAECAGCNAMVPPMSLQMDAQGWLCPTCQQTTDVLPFLF